jgi:RND family efflux transporter MFP subunit
MKIALTGCLLAVSSLMIGGCHHSESASQAAIQTAQARVVESQLQQVPQSVTATGTIHARETAIISSQVTGRIQQVLVHEGDKVRAGETLVVLEGTVLRASSDQARATAKAALSNQIAAQTDAKLASSTLERYRQLQSEKSVSPQEMDEVSRRSEAATARLEVARLQAIAAQAQESGARAMQDYTHLRASFSGFVTARMADPGTIASPGVPLLQVDQAGALQLQVPVDESAIGAIRKGMKVNVKIAAASSADTMGTVSEIIPAADPSSHSFTVKIDLPASDSLHAGIYGTSEFTTGIRQAVLVARSAVVQHGSLVCAYVLDGQGVARLRYLTLGAARGNLVEVLSGISTGERLVDNPADRDLAGKRIEVQP